MVLRASERLLIFIYLFIFDYVCKGVEFLQHAASVLLSYSKEPLEKWNTMRDGGGRGG